jgi:hypothetical protein
VIRVTHPRHHRDVADPALFVMCRIIAFRRAPFSFHVAHVSLLLTSIVVITNPIAPHVRDAQAAPARMVVELSLIRRVSHDPAWLTHFCGLVFAMFRH